MLPDQELDSSRKLHPPFSVADPGNLERLERDVYVAKKHDNHPRCGSRGGGGADFIDFEHSDSSQ